MDTRVVFIENENKHKKLLYSLNRLNISYTRLNKGKEWISNYNKVVIYAEGLKNLDNEYVLLSDSRDVLFYRKLADINELYDSYYSDYDIIIQAEDSDLGTPLFRKSGLSRYKFNDEHYCYICSGLIMGKRTVLIDFFEELHNKCPNEWKECGDQSAIEWGMINFDYNIELDSDCRLFQQTSYYTHSFNPHLHYNKNFIKNTYTNSEPCIFHAAGKSNYNQVWKIITDNY